jgi:hypothetical protein
VPELGLVDGAEGSLRLGAGWRAGGGAGALPLPFPARTNNEDFGVHAFVTWREEDPARPAAGALLGVQKTWHFGDPDRDLVFGHGDWRPLEWLGLSGSFKLDVYTSSDDLKGSGAELTEAWGRADFRPSQEFGFGVSGSLYRWPQLQRREYFGLPDELVRSGSIDRVAADGWWRVASDLKLRGRVDAWQDHEQDGTGFDAGFEWTDLFGARLDLFVDLFVRDGSFSDGPGVRAMLAQSFDQARFGLRYEEFAYDFEGLATGSESFTSRRVGLGVDWYPGDAWDLRFDVDHAFGDGENGWHLGAFAQVRF